MISRTHLDSPKLSQEHETPADEWAKETEGAIDQHSPRKVVTNIDRRNGTTPGYELPGAFPITQTPEASPTSTDFGETAKQSIEGAYMTAHNGIDSVYASAEHAARQYLPTSIVDKLEGVGVLRENLEYQDKPSKPSVPTQGSESNFKPTHSRPTHSRDGSLPGSKDEARIASLPEEMNGEEAKKAKHATLPTETGSHQRTYKESILSTTAYTSSPTAMTETPDSNPFPADSSPQDPPTAAAVSSNMNHLTSQPPTSHDAKVTALESENSTATSASPSSSVSLTGTLTSPDSDAQAAARAGLDALEPGEAISAGPGPDGDLNAAAQPDVNGRGDIGTDKGEGSPTRVNVSDTDGPQTVKKANSSHIDKGGRDGQDDEGASIGNGKESHSSKSFVQKLKGEAKAFAEKVKTKRRG